MNGTHTSYTLIHTSLLVTDSMIAPKLSMVSILTALYGTEVEEGQSAWKSAMTWSDFLTFLSPWPA